MSLQNLNPDIFALTDEQALRIALQWEDDVARDRQVRARRVREQESVREVESRQNRRALQVLAAPRLSRLVLEMPPSRYAERWRELGDGPQNGPGVRWQEGRDGSSRLHLHDLRSENGGGNALEEWKEALRRGDGSARVTDSFEVDEFEVEGCDWETEMYEEICESPAPQIARFGVSLLVALPRDGSEYREARRLWGAPGAEDGSGQRVRFTWEPVRSDSVWLDPRLRRLIFPELDALDCEDGNPVLESKRFWRVEAVAPMKDELQRAFQEGDYRALLGMLAERFLCAFDGVGGGRLGGAASAAAWKRCADEPRLAARWREMVRALTCGEEMSVGSFQGDDAADARSENGTGAYEMGPEAASRRCVGRNSVSRTTRQRARRWSIHSS
jgi:hypothetical protein